MFSYHPDLLARAVPRYTSYPTAAEFTDAPGAADMEEAIAGIAEGERASLYLHIPFCRQICWYCGCNTGAANRAVRLATYLERLEREIELVAARVDGRARVSRIAFGGGSPNAINPAAFLRLIKRVRSAFNAHEALVSVEVDPRGFDADWARALGEVGASRVSLGVQTLDPAIQWAIGRIQPIDEIRLAVERLRAAQVESINFDLMYGLPGQDETSLATTLAEALALGPDRLAVFGYAHVPHMIPRQRRIDDTALPDAALRFRQAALAQEIATGAGYRTVGFDHFALPHDALARAAAEGRLRRNFQGFTEDDAETLIGLGASAISQFPDRLLQNEKNTGRWHMAISGDRLATARGVIRTPKDRVRGRAIEELLCTGRATLSGWSSQSSIRERLAPFESRGLLRWHGDVVEMAVGAEPYWRVVAATLDAYRDDAGHRFSSAV